MKDRFARKGEKEPPSCARRRPVKTGSRVRNRIKLLGAEDKGSRRFLLTTENTIEIEGETKPGLIANALVMAIAS